VCTHVCLQSEPDNLEGNVVGKEGPHRSGTSAEPVHAARRISVREVFAH